MTSSSSRWIPAALGLLLAAGVLAGSGRAPAPEEVALAYGRALYASDADAIWRLVSEADRRAKDQATFRRQLPPRDGFAREAVHQLAGFVTARPVKTTTIGDRASVTLRFQLPDANAPVVRTLLHDWDEARLNRLGGDERTRIREKLDELRRAGRLPIIEGDEPIELVRDASGWKVFLNWAGGVGVRFEAAVDEGVPLQILVAPASAVLAPGERLRVTVQATNTSRREVTTRVGHRIEPEAQANHLALLICPLVVPVTLPPGQTQEFFSEYLLLAGVPADAKQFAVTYRFTTTPPEGRQ